MTEKLPMPAPSDGIKAIQYSRMSLAFSFGWLVPVLGTPFGLVSFSYLRKARAASQGSWNPAKKQLFWAVTITRIGLFITLGPLAVVVTAILLNLVTLPFRQ